ncbi:DUF4394 domain-containing protein [Acidovorax sp. sic0104]|uniref:DUF4394 domain-containing protein n=1 Tax=Acidovorax sp. sic0104 TaxID=2854784 RepID=UPI001C45FB0A|nr:DUF4394 domain-containing protein [Acidovorax sp. sic0104]MBV7542387.1 DUF4394 domain-containing protein [Acidovorax sp. sic0104]
MTLKSLSFAHRPAMGALLAVAAVVAGCSTSPPADPSRRELVVAVTAAHELITFNAGDPGRVLERRPVTGLPEGERLVGIDFRVARGVLYALAQSGRLYTLDIPSGALRPVGAAAAVVPLKGRVFGFDFNPAADRIRVVSNTGLNLRLHPDTGAVVDGDAAADGVQPDPWLRYAASDVNAGRTPDIAGAAYTYNTQDSKITTNYAIDRALGVLVMQGSLEGTTPVVSPNTGQLRTVGPLGLGPLADVSFDIADVGNAALAAVRTATDLQTRLVLVDLKTGAARLLGRVGEGAPLVGIAIEP